MWRGVVLGKTNTPELGAGGNTFNEVFGPTFNPWDTTLNAGGSSGGAAASLAAGEIWLSHGSDHGGSTYEHPRHIVELLACVQALEWLVAQEQIMLL